MNSTKQQGTKSTNKNHWHLHTQTMNNLKRKLQKHPTYNSTRKNKVQSFSYVRLFVTPWTAPRQASCSLTTPGACLNSCPLSQWCHPTISSSVIPFPSCLQSFPASRSFPKSQSFTSGGQRIGVSASASVLPMNIQDWFPLGWTAWISLQDQRLSSVFNNTAQKHQLFSTQLSRYSDSHIHKWLLESHSLD